MAEMTVRFDPDHDSWVFAAGVGGPGASVAVAFGGLRWVVPNLSCAAPTEVEIDASLPRWALAAVRHLLGVAAADAIEGDRGGPDRAIELDDDLDVLARRAAMGMLAVAAAQPAGSALRPLDLAALVQRAGLAGLSAPFPGLDQLADDAAEALEVLPPVVLEALVSDAGLPRPGHGAVGWGVASAGVADAGRLIYRATGDLPVGVDVGDVFAALTDGLAAQLFGDVADAPKVPVLMGGEFRTRTPAFRGGPRPAAPRALEALIVDMSIRGVMGAVAFFDPGSRAVSVTLTTRSMALHPASPPLLVRVIAQQTGAVQECVPLQPDRSPDAGGRLLARITMPADVEPARVEVVLHEDQPWLELAPARQLHRTSELLEGERVLRQSTALLGDARATVRSRRESIAAAILQGPLAELAGSPELDVFPLPSDGLLVVLGDLADEVKAGLEAIERPAERAAAARNTARLGAWSVVPWVHRLIGDLAMIEARACVDPDDRPNLNETRAGSAARRAVTAYTQAGEPGLASEAEAWAARHGGDLS